MSTPSKLVIIGAGVFSGEVRSWFEDLPEGQIVYKGCLDDNPAAADSADEYLGTTHDYEPEADDVFVCAIGSTRARLAVCRRLQERGWKFTTLIHPTARVDRKCVIGEGSIVGPFVYIGPGAKLGAFVLLNVSASVGHDATLGDGVTMSSHTDLTGQAVLEEGVYVGSHASVLQKVRIGAYATVGAGSVAIRNVKPEITVFGLPAKAIS